MSEPLATSISRALATLQARLGDAPIVRLALDCQPWNAFLEGAVLTAEEAKRDPVLLDPAEMAAWQHYAFTSDDEDWARQTADLRSRMSADYRSGGDRANVKRHYFKLCADALASPEVRKVLCTFNTTDDFQCTVTDPDTNEEFVGVAPGSD